MPRRSSSTRSSRGKTTSTSLRCLRTTASTERARRHTRSPLGEGRVLLFNKPYGVACQFSPCGDHATLGDFIPVRGVYPAGRLDADSEGLLVLTDSGALQHRIAHPRAKLPKTYWAQVEAEPNQEQLAALASGIELGDFVTRPARARVIPELPGLWVRDPPIRFRKTVPTAWLELVLVEGRNRQVRRMTAAVGLPTLRLVRCRIGDWSIGDLAPGEWRDVDVGALQKE